MKENLLTIKYPDDVLLSLKESREEFEDEARYFLALKFYELGKISSGKAAKLAGLSRVEFLMRLGRYKVSPFQVDLDEILTESRNDG
jgi:predicted HTH domain antitoxin